MSQSKIMWASLAIFTPERGFDMDCAIAHITQVVAAIEQTKNINVTILKCLHHPWVAVFGVHREFGINNLLKAADFTEGLSPLTLVETKWFRQASQKTREDLPFAKISLGDTLTIRTINCFSSKKQENISNSCNAILKGSDFNCHGDMFCWTFYNSMDYQKIIGIATWKCFESACFLPNPAPPLLGHIAGASEVRLNYHIYKAVYVTHTVSAQGSSLPGFQI